jgi:hypothetical protein
MIIISYVTQELMMLSTCKAKRMENSYVSEDAQGIIYTTWILGKENRMVIVTYSIQYVITRETSQY